VEHRSEGGDEVEELEDEAYVVESHVGEFVVLKSFRMYFSKFDILVIYSFATSFA